MSATTLKQPPRATLECAYMLFQYICVWHSALLLSISIELHEPGFKLMTSHLPHVSAGAQHLSGWVQTHDLPSTSCFCRCSKPVWVGIDLLVLLLEYTSLTTVPID